MIDENAQIWSSTEEKETKTVKDIPELMSTLPSNSYDGNVKITTIELIL